MVNLRVRWTDEEEKLLREMWEHADMRLEDMAKVLKSRTAATIRQKASTLGLPSPGSRQKPDIDYEFLKKITNPEDI